MLPFEPSSFDVIWSEGAIYVIGFEAGLAKVKEYVKPGGYVAVSEAVWLAENPPQAAVEFWKEYPEIDSIEDLLDFIAKIRDISGLPVGFKSVIGAYGWLESLCQEINRRGIEQAPDFIAVDHIRLLIHIT